MRDLDLMKSVAVLLQLEGELHCELVFVNVSMSELRFLPETVEALQPPSQSSKEPSEDFKYV